MEYMPSYSHHVAESGQFRSTSGKKTRSVGCRQLRCNQAALVGDLSDDALNQPDLATASNIGLPLVTTSPLRSNDLAPGFQVTL